MLQTEVGIGPVRLLYVTNLGLHTREVQSDACVFERERVRVRGREIEIEGEREGETPMGLGEVTKDQ